MSYGTQDAAGPIAETRAERIARVRQETAEANRAQARAWKEEREDEERERDKQQKRKRRRDDRREQKRKKRKKRKDQEDEVISALLEAKQPRRSYDYVEGGVRWRRSAKVSSLIDKGRAPEGVDLRDPAQTKKALEDRLDSWEREGKFWHQLSERERAEVRTLMISYASYAKLDTVPGGTVLWSGGGSVAGAAADSVASQHGVEGAKRLEGTEAGGTLNDLTARINNRKSGDNEGPDWFRDLKPAWDMVSGRLASQAEGEVTAVTTQDPGRGINPNSILLVGELPKIRARQAMGKVSEVKFKTTTTIKDPANPNDYSKWTAGPVSDASEAEALRTAPST